MQTQEPDENGITHIKCEHCGGGETMITKPVPSVILPALVCRDCRKDASGTFVPILQLPV